MARILDIVFRRQVAEPPIPICPDHKIEMHLRGKMGRPTRFSDMSQETYTVIYVCPVIDCDHSKEVQQVRSQIAVPANRRADRNISRRGH